MNQSPDGLMRWLCCSGFDKVWRNFKEVNALIRVRITLITLWDTAVVIRVYN